MSEVDDVIFRSQETLERTRLTRRAPGSAARKRREREVMRRVGRIAAADAAIIVAALVIGFFVPLGMFGDTRYETQWFRLEPADRLLVVSDGVHAATPDGRPPYGETALLNAVRRTRLQPATEAVGTVMRGLGAYHAGADPADDAVTVCLDWRPGRPRAGG